MKKIELPTLAINGELFLDHVYNRQSGYGHKTIFLDIIYKNQKKTFSKTTNNMHSYDEAMDLDYEDRKEALYNIIDYQIEEAVCDWTQGIDWDELN